MGEDDDTKICPYCAKMIEEAAVVCPFCGQEQPGEGWLEPGPDEPRLQIRVIRDTAPARDQRPVIGFIGLVLLSFGGLLAIMTGSTIAILILIVGAAVLAIALFTGNVKLLG